MQVGDTVKLAVLGPQTEVVPTDLQMPLARADDLKEINQNK